MRIDISPFRKEDVLVALYSHAKQVGLGSLQDNIELTQDAAKKILDQSSYVDYLHGRLIKVDFEHHLLDPFNYDAQYGVGHAFSALRRMELNLQSSKDE